MLHGGSISSVCTDMICVFLGQVGKAKKIRMRQNVDKLVGLNGLRSRG